MPVSTSTGCLTCDDIAEFVGAVIPTDKVSEADDDQAQDGSEDAKPLAGLQPSPQEGHGEQAGEDDYGPAQHLEAGGAGHVESWKSSTEKLFDWGDETEKHIFTSATFMLDLEKKTKQCN